MSAALTRASRRHLARHPWQLALTVIGVALGVAVVVAVDLANESARRGFEISMERVTGAATHRIVGGPRGLPESLYTELRVEAGVRRSAPVVEGYATARGQTLHVLGTDPLAETGSQRPLGDLDEETVRRLMSEPGSVVMADVTARRLGVSTGDRIDLTAGGERHTVTLIGSIPVEGREAASLDGLVITDVSTAQSLLGRVGRLTRIDLTIPDGPVGASLVERVRSVVPDGAELAASGSRTRAMRAMTRGFRTNLSAMSLLALVVGLFLVYNTMTFAVLQRRRLLGTFRVLGVTPGGLTRLVLREALILGLIGSALGVAAGIALGQGLVHLVTRTINDLYFVLTVTDLDLSAAPLAKGLVLGVAGTLLAALLPAVEAGRTTPQAALARSAIEGRAQRIAPRIALLGAGLALAGAALLIAPVRDLTIGFVALFMILLGAAFVAPAVTSLAVRILARPAGRMGGVQARLALRGVDASLSRTGIAVAALMLAVATTVGVAVMVDSFRQTVRSWLETTLGADIYVSAPEPAGATAAPLAPSVLARVRDVNGVADISTGRRVRIESAAGPVTVLALAPPADRAPRYDLLPNAVDDIWQRFRDGGIVLVSEPYAFHHDVAVGDTVRLRTDDGPRAFEVGGVYRDYGSSAGVILMPRAAYDRHFDDTRISGIGIYIASGAVTDSVLQRVRRALADHGPILVRSHRELRERSMAIFDRTFTITRVLRLLAVVVAVIGILSALMALQLERTRELAVLRATGFTPGQIARQVLGQSAALGVAAGALAIPTGLVLAEALIHVINRRAFGWSMETRIEPEPLVAALALGVGAALLAGVYPALRMARTPVAESLREE